MHKRKLLIILLFILGSYLYSNNVVKNIKKSIINFSPFKVKFTQQVFIDNEKEVEEGGFIVFKNIKKLKWVYNNPELKVFLLKGNKYYYYNKEENQLKKGKIGEYDNTSIWRIFFSEKGFKYVSNKKGRIKIIDTKENIEFKVKYDDSFLPVEVTQDDGSGIIYKYFFYDFKKKIQIKDSEFELELPKGVEIINE